LPPPAPNKNITQFRENGKSQEVIKVDKKKMGRPTDNPRTEKIGFRMSKEEIEDIQECANALNTQRVNAVVEGIKLLKEKLGIK
jgi:hypothetical protein